MHLTKEQVRTDLTDRECARIIGGIIGSLCGMTNTDTVRNAIKWWALTDSAWISMKNLEKAAETARNQIRNLGAGATRA